MNPEALVHSREGQLAAESKIDATRGGGEQQSVADQFGEHADEMIGALRSLRRPRVFIISGPSGVGKDTVIESLRLHYPDAHFAVTATTRPRRPGEIDGVHYYFMNLESFQQHLNDHEFLESATVYGHFYGVPRGPVRAALSRGVDVFIKVDVQGAEAIRQAAPHTTSIFLAPESMTALLQRLRARKTDDPEVLMARFSAASKELASAASFDYVIFNESDRVESAIERIRSIVVAEHLRTSQPAVHL